MSVLGCTRPVIYLCGNIFVNNRIKVNFARIITVLCVYIYIPVFARAFLKLILCNFCNILCNHFVRQVLLVKNYLVNFMS